MKNRKISGLEQDLHVARKEAVRLTARMKPNLAPTNGEDNSALVMSSFYLYHHGHNYSLETFDVPRLHQQFSRSNHHEMHAQLVST
jgi:hypothetical protein